MAISTLSDFKIYEEQYFAGQNEWLQQNTDVFNTASLNAVRFVTQRRKGQYEQEAFFKGIANLVVRRDPTSTSTVTSKKIEQDEFVRVKVNRRVGPAEVTRDSFKKVGLDPESFSFYLGQQIAPAVQVDYCNTAIASCAAAIRGVSALVTDKVTGDGLKTMRHTYLANALAKFGDASGRIKCWVMHSKPFYDLVAQSITDNVFQVGGLVVMGGIPPTLGKPTIVVDSPALVETSGSSTTSYLTLGLVEDAVVVNQSEEQEIMSQAQLGNENLGIIIQGEHAYHVGVKGFKYDMTNGGVNPTDTALATSTNWELANWDSKMAAGVLLVTD